MQRDVFTPGENVHKTHNLPLVWVYFVTCIFPREQV